jgi:hypothetical protein
MQGMQIKSYNWSLLSMKMSKVIQKLNIKSTFLRNVFREALPETAYLPTAARFSDG